MKLSLRLISQNLLTLTNQNTKNIKTQCFKKKLLKKKKN